MFLKTFSFLDSDDQRRSKDPVKDLRCFFVWKQLTIFSSLFSRKNLIIDIWQCRNNWVKNLLDNKINKKLAHRKELFFH